MLRHSTLDDIEYSRYSFSSKLRRKYGNAKASRTKSGKSKTRRNSEQNVNRNFSIDQCAVCLEDDATHKLDTKLFPCGHVFHGQCLIEWVNSLQQNNNSDNAANATKFSCPLCRQNIAHFVQLTSNQQINEKLVSLWNEMYLFGKNNGASTSTAKSNSSSITLEQSNTECCPKACIATVVPKEVEVASASPVAPSPTLSSLLEADHATESAADSRTMTVVASVGSVWRLLCSLSPVPYKREGGNLAALLAANSNACNLWLCDVADVGLQQSEAVRMVATPTLTRQHLDWPHYRLYNDTEATQQRTAAAPASVSATTPPRHVVLLDELRCNLINFESGIAAGVLSALSMHVMTHQLRFELTHSHRGLAAALRVSPLLSVLSETVPSVAMFFGTYEAMKQYLFHIDNVSQSASLTFGQRFCSATMASSVSYCVGAKGNLMVANRHFLPFRFGTFFGAFEFCKDWLNRDHTQLGVAKVAASAAVGGTAAHVVYYPLLAYQNNFVAPIENVPLWANGRALYRGWLSSFRKFLPSTVLCSISFEYTKRYLHGNI